jgi:hypothetical protein
MLSFHGGRILLDCVLLAWVRLAEAKSPRTDAFGDPLPEETLLRLGTLRFHTRGTDPWQLDLSRRALQLQLIKDRQ